ncbi:MAG: hypothetical protein WCG78_03125, partial [Candidatus Omnitrophota bacterium]
YTHALVQRLFGPGEFPLRMYGVFHFILSLILMLLIIRELTDERERVRPLALAAGAVLFLVNPLLLQHSVVINADNNILTSAILFFLFFLIRGERLNGDGYLRSRFILAGLFALCLWSKEMAPLFMMAGIIGFRLANREFEKALFDGVLIGVLGAVIFWSSWWAYCAASGTDLLGFVKFTMINKSKLAFSRGYLNGIFDVAFYGSRWNIFWAGAPFFLAILGFLAARGRVFAATGKGERVDLIFVCAAAIWIPFQFFRPTIDMVKYQYPAYPLLIICIAWLFARIAGRRFGEERRVPGGMVMAALFGAVVVFTLHYYLIGDYLLALWAPLVRHLEGHFLFYYFLPIAAVCSVVAIASRGQRLRENLVIAMIIMAIPVNIGLDLNHAKADYATTEIWLNYGERGLRETAEYLRSQIKKSTIVSVRADIEYYLVYRYNLPARNIITPEKIFSLVDQRMVRALFAQVPIEYLVVDRISTNTRVVNGAAAVIEEYFTFDRQIGSFYVYRRAR